MNDQKIFECLSQNGASTDVELAIWLATSPEDIHGQMAALIAVGDVVCADNSFTRSYVFSERFKTTDEYAKLRRRAEILRFTQDPNDTTPEARAHHFMLANGRQATSAELHMAMGLAPDELPSAVLAEALAAGRLFRDGKHWFLDRRTAARELPAVPEPVLALPDGIAIPVLLEPQAQAVVIWPDPAKAEPIHVEDVPLRVPSFSDLSVSTAPRLTMSRRHDKSVLIKRGADRIALNRAEIDQLLAFVKENDIA